MIDSYFSQNRWPKIVLQLAALYNIAWGSSVVLFPEYIFKWVNAPLPTYLSIWQCVGMIVGVYGVGYFIASFNPTKHWAIILVGLLGKFFGPIGFLYHIQKGTYPLQFGWVIIGNDLIWWGPFCIILYTVFKESKYA